MELIDALLGLGFRSISGRFADISNSIFRSVDALAVRKTCQCLDSLAREQES